MDINPTTKNIPNLNPNNCILSDKGDPLIASIMKYIKCPPSKTGTGSKFIIPKLILSSARNPKYAEIPYSADCPATLPIVMGPLRCLREISPINIFLIEPRIITEISQVL